MKSKRINDLIDWLAISCITLLICGAIIFLPVFGVIKFLDWQEQKAIEYQQNEYQQYLDWKESGEF